MLAVISIETIIYVVLFILGAGIIFGALMWLIGYIEREFPNTAPFPKFARIALVVMSVLVFIAIILGFMGHPVVSF